MRRIATSLAGFAGATLVCGILAAPAGAVGARGNLIRVDADPGTAWYGFFTYQVAPTQNGGFGVAWEEDTKEDKPFFPVIEGLKVRIFKNNFTPAGPPKPPDLSGHTAPSLNSLFRVGNDKLLLAYGTTRRTSPSETRRELFGQAIAIANEALGARKLLNSTINTGAVFARSTGIKGGRGIFGWFDGLVSPNTPANIRGRFIDTAGTPKPPNLNLALSAGFALAEIKPVGTGFVALYRRTDGSNTQVSARVYKTDGTPLGPARLLAQGASGLPLIVGFPDGRILVASWVASASQANLVAQVYTSAWTKSGGAKILITAGAANDRVDLAPLPDGGVLVARTFGAYPTYKHTIRRFNKTLSGVGAAYTIPSVGLDFAKIAVLSANRAVLVFKQNPGRSRLVAQILNL